MNSIASVSPMRWRVSGIFNSCRSWFTCAPGEAAPLFLRPFFLRALFLLGLGLGVRLLGRRLLAGRLGPVLRRGLGDLAPARVEPHRAPAGGADLFDRALRELLRADRQR